MSDYPLAIQPPGFGDAPVGSVLAFAGQLGPPIPGPASEADQSPPDPDHVTASVEAWGWMLCDGRSLDVGGYPELFAALGYRYGGSDATFNIPDYRGAFLRGTDLGANVDPDKGLRTNAQGQQSPDVGSRQPCALQDHEHNASIQLNGAAQPGAAAGVLSGPPPTQTGKVYADPTAKPAIQISKNETRPANIAVNYIIKFTYALTLFKG